jgi:diguanylate cyclase (GGDEF)-like protein
MVELATNESPPAVTPADVLVGALVDSRRRWRELIDLVADFAFETDAAGRFTLVIPDPALGWPAEALVGKFADALLAEGGGTVFSPFRLAAKTRHRDAWLRRGDGGVACLTFSVAPIQDATGLVAGMRGGGIDVTELDDRVAGAAVALRRSEVVDHIMARIATEVVASHMMAAGLNGLAEALGSEGVAVIVAAADATDARVAHSVGTGVEFVTAAVNRQLLLGDPGRVQMMTGDRRHLMIAPCLTRSRDRTGLAVWRSPDARAWDEDDDLLMRTVVRLVGMLLEREAVHAEMTRLARTDPLTGLLNRRAFLDDVERRTARQDQENEAGILMFADLDHFKAINDQLGHDAGDKVLQCAAALLRKTFRPTDLIARLGGDEFAVWLNGADAVTALERAGVLHAALPRDVAELCGAGAPRVTMSIGIVSRDPGESEPFDNVMRRADNAMYEVKRGRSGG